MAKPKDEGFPYCQQDTDIYFDSKIRMLLSRFGCDGYCVWDYIKQAAYREHGYYVEWTDERSELAALDLGISAEKTGLIVAYLLKRSLLVSKSFNGITVLTSHGIQNRFQNMAKSAKREYYEFRPEIWILSETETVCSIFHTLNQDNSGIKGDNSGIKGDNSGIKPQKNSKVNIKEKIYKKENESFGEEEETERATEKEQLPLIEEESNNSGKEGKKRKSFIPPTLDEVKAYAIERGRSDLAEKFFEYFETGNWHDSQGKPVRNWKQKFVTWDTKNPKPKSSAHDNDTYKVL